MASPTFRNNVLASLSAGLLLVASFPAHAEVDCDVANEASLREDMQLRVEAKDSADALVIEGKLSSDLPAQLAETLKQHPEIDEVRFNSAGGDVAAALEAGMLLRKVKGLLTRIPAGSTCAEACALLFLGGMPRLVDTGGTFALGSLYRADRSATAPERVNQAVALHTSEILNYLMRVGVSKRLWIDEVERQKAVAQEGKQAGSACLTREQLFRYGVAYLSELESY